MDSSSPQWPQWATLQRDLLFKIASCLDTRTDLLHFRAVCCSWRSSIPLPPKTPSPHPSLKLPFPIFPNQPFNRNRHGHFVLTESTIYSLQPLNKMSNTSSATDTETYLVKAEELDSGKVILKDPLSLFTFTPFSTLCLMEEMPEVLNLLDYKVSEVANAYGLVFLDQGKTPVTNVFIGLDDHKSICMKKVVVSSSFDKIDEEFGFAVMVLDFDGNVGVWKIGDEKWTNINDNRKGSYYVDISFHNGKFYALDITELTITVDPKNFRSRRIVRARSGFGFGANRFTYLVESFENLFRVDKLDFSLGDSPFAHSCDFDVNYPILFLIYKLNEEKKEWVKVSGLEDRALFIGCDCSFSVSANNFPGCKRNCVYFLDDSFVEDDNEGLLAAGFFALEDFRSMRLSKFPCYSKIFYPPPAWLKNNPNSV